mgnify:CR=1 FL=1|tara:strand:- start:2052 stop:2321 length:270 start_codon:yes stop_codon:yes gene_type:complete
MNLSDISYALNSIVGKIDDEIGILDERKEEVGNVMADLQSHQEEVESELDERENVKASIEEFLTSLEYTVNSLDDIDSILTYDGTELTQ